MLQLLKIENFTVFDKLSLEFSKGINVFIGENGTGKTNILKILYSACDIIENDKSFPQKITDVFYPSNKSIGRLIKRKGKSTNGNITIKRKINNNNNNTASISLSMSSHIKDVEKVKVTGMKEWKKNKSSCAYIPVKDMMANAPGFLSAVNLRELHFEEIYSDIVTRANLPKLRGKIDDVRQSILDILAGEISGSVALKNEEFFLRKKHENLEFTLLAEGYRKLGLLWILIQNGILLSGSVLFWDEPEANLHPKLFSLLVDIFLKLQRHGVQIFIATHDYILAKYIEIRACENDTVQFYSLYKGEDQINCETCSTFRDLKHNPIMQAFEALLDEVYNSNKG